MTISELLNPRETAKLLRTTTGTLAVWRCKRRRPLPFVKLSRKVFYRAEDVQAYIAANVVPGDGPKPARFDKEKKGGRK